MHSPIDDGDSTQIQPGDLVGLLLGDAIKKHVISDRDPPKPVPPKPQPGLSR
jgi:hypothetical protein